MKTPIWVKSIYLFVLAIIFVIGMVLMIPSLTLPERVAWPALKLCLGSIAATIYFFPTLHAYGIRKRNSPAIFVLNLFLGWTLLGWVAALVWAFTKDAEKARE